MSSTYFSGEAWPSAAEACAASRAPPAFAKIYQLLFYKHLFHSDCQPVMTANEKLWHLAQSWAHYSGFIEACIGEPQRLIAFCCLCCHLCCQSMPINHLALPWLACLAQRAVL